MEEGHYLAAILNSDAIQNLVVEYQPVGAFGPRHFHKHVFEVPFPIFDAAIKEHRNLASMGAVAEMLSATANIDGLGFQKARSEIRKHISKSVGRAIEPAVESLL